MDRADIVAADRAGVAGRISMSRSWLRSGAWPNRLLIAVITVIFAVLIVPPLLTVIATSLHPGGELRTNTYTLQNFRDALDLLGSAPLVDTAIFAAGSSAFAVLLGCVGAWLSERTNAVFRHLIIVVAVIGLSVPTVIQSIGWVFLLGPNNGILTDAWRSAFGGAIPPFPLYSMTGLVMVQGVLMFPVAFLLLMPSFGAASQHLDEAGLMSGASLRRVAWRISLPLMRPAILAALILCCILAIETFEAPSIIGSPAGITLLSTAIANDINSSFPNYGIASAYSMFTVIFAVVLIVLYQRAVAAGHKYQVVSGKGYRRERIDLRGYRWPGGILVILLALLVLAPLLVIMWEAFLPTYEAPSVDALHKLTFSNFHSVFDLAYGFVPAARHTFVFALIAGVVVTVLCVNTAWLGKTSKRLRRLDHLGTVALVIPGVVLGLAFFQLSLSASFDVSVYVIIVALIVSQIPYGMRFSAAGVASIHSELDEAASVSGAGLARRIFFIVMPLMRRTLFACGLFVFIGVVRNLSVVLFLSRSNTTVVSFQMYEAWSQGAFPVAAAMATLIALALLVITGLAALLMLGRT